MRPEEDNRQLRESLEDDDYETRHADARNRISRTCLVCQEELNTSKPLAL